MSVTTTVLFGLDSCPEGYYSVGFVRIRSQSGRFWPHGTRNWTFWLGWTAWTVALVILFGVSMFASWTRSR